MSYVKVTDERTGKPKKFVSERAIRQYIADLKRRQERLLSGKTLSEPTPNVLGKKGQHVQTIRKSYRTFDPN